MPTKKTISVRWETETPSTGRSDAESHKALSLGLRSLYEATEELQFSKPMGVLLKALLRGLKTGTGLTRAAVFVHDENGGALQGAAALGIADSKIVAVRIPLESEDEDQLLQLKLFHEGPSDAQNTHDRLCAALRGATGWQGARLIPLEIRDRLVGVLAYDPGTHATLLPEITVLFARQAAFTIDNAKLFTQVEEMALRDPLTGLYNRRYLMQILEYELNRARRYRQPLSVVFLDLDHFKAINDTCGHAMGDKLLKQIATRLASMFRTTDVVGRIAGDEFLAVLPNTPRAGAHVLADRLLKALKDYEMMVRGQTVRVSVSIGLDSFEGEDGVGSATLIDRADKAMYQAKSTGRGRICAFRAEEPPVAVLA